MKEKSKVSIASSAPTVSFSTNIGLVITLILMSSASVHYGEFYIDTPTAVAVAAAAAAARINIITTKPTYATKYVLRYLCKMTGCKHCN